jgi:AcrR family transcriptional regulator
MDVASVDKEVTWSFMRRFLPFDLDGLAVETGALERRRGVGDGERLLRTLLLYGVPHASIARVAQEAKRLNLADMSGPGLFYRIKNAERFLAAVFERLLVHTCEKVETWKGLRLAAVDATPLSGPGATGTDQRLHAAYDLGAGRPLHVDLTGPEGGETFRRFLDVGPGSLVLADQGYGHGPGIVPLLLSGANVLVRFNFYSIRLLDLDGVKITPERAESMLDPEGTIEFEAMLPGWDRPVRIFGARNPEGEGVWLLTDLPESVLKASEVREVYSRRWQIELYFKRLKSLLDLDDLASRSGPTARPWVWIKLILATLAVLIGHERFSPWGCPASQETGQASEGTEQAAAPTRRRGRPPKGGGGPDKPGEPPQVQSEQAPQPENPAAVPPTTAKKEKSRPKRSLWNLFALAARAIHRALFEPIVLKERRGRPKGRKTRRGRTPKQLTFWRNCPA